MCESLRSRPEHSPSGRVMSRRRHPLSDFWGIPRDMILGDPTEEMTIARIRSCAQPKDVARRLGSAALKAKSWTGAQRRNIRERRRSPFRKASACFASVGAKFWNYCELANRHCGFAIRRWRGATGGSAPASADLTRLKWQSLRLARATSSGYSRRPMQRCCPSQSFQNPSNRFGDSSV